MRTYVGRTVMLKSGKKGVVVSEIWEGCPMLEIILMKGKKNKSIWLPDYEVVVM